MTPPPQYPCPLRTLAQISGKTVENTVYLTGMASTLEAKNRAEEMARQVEGVQKVVNDMILQP